MAFVRGFLLLQNLLSSIAMGLYMHSVFHGQFLFITAYQPEIVNFHLAIVRVGLPIAFYLFSQSLAMAMRPPASIVPTFFAWLSTVFPLAEIASATFNTAGMSLFQFGAWELWLPLELIDLSYFVVSARLLTRAFVGDTNYGGHHGF